MIHAKKSLGQNFLKENVALEAIVNSANIKSDDTILEVGPGTGILTEKLLEKAEKVIAVEKDDRLIEILSLKFGGEIKSGKFQLIHGDILNLAPATYNLKPYEYKVVANIPYYITGQFLRMYLESDCQPLQMVLMLQKEVAERISAKNGKESILSLSVKAYGKPSYVKTIPKESFDPVPKVDSAIIFIDHISKEFFSGFSEKSFFEIVKKGFGQKRKMLLGNIKIILPNSAEIFEKNNIPLKVRAEDIPLEKWSLLAREYQAKA